MNVYNSLLVLGEEAHFECLGLMTKTFSLKIQLSCVDYYYYGDSQDEKDNREKNKKVILKKINKITNTRTQVASEQTRLTHFGREKDIPI